MGRNTAYLSDCGITSRHIFARFSIRDDWQIDTILNYIRLLILGVGMACLVIILSAMIASAAEAQIERTRLSDANITVHVDNESSVTAIYKFSTGPGDFPRNYINGTIWRFQSQEISSVAVWVNGEPTEPSVTSESRHIYLGVPMYSVTNRKVKIRLQYTVSGTEERGKIPLWVPNVTHGNMNPVVNTALKLPDTTRKQGFMFPIPDRTTADGRVLHSRTAHVPAFIFIPYGQQQTNLFVMETIKSFNYFIFRDQQLTRTGLVSSERVMTLAGQLKVFIILSAGFVVTAGLWIRYKNQQEPQHSDTTRPDDTGQTKQGNK